MKPSRSGYSRSSLGEATISHSIALVVVSPLAEVKSLRESLFLQCSASSAYMSVFGSPRVRVRVRVGVGVRVRVRFQGQG